MCPSFYLYLEMLFTALSLSLVFLCTGISRSISLFHFYFWLIYSNLSLSLLVFCFSILKSLTQLCLSIFLSLFVSCYSLSFYLSTPSECSYFSLAHDHIIPYLWLVRTTVYIELKTSVHVFLYTNHCLSIYLLQQINLLTHLPHHSVRSFISFCLWFIKIYSRSLSSLSLSR